MKNSQKILSRVAILTLFICAAGGTLENSAIQRTLDAWPNVSSTMIRMLTTLPSFISMFVMIYVGRTVGKNFSYKRSIVFGLMCMLIGGLLPYFVHPSWIVVLVFRAIIGIGIGFATLGNPLLIRTIAAQDLARYIGMGGIVGNVATVIMNPIVGSLAKLGWNYALLANCVYMLPLLFCLFFLKEPEPIQNHIQNTNQTKTPLPKIIYIFITFQFISTMVLFPLLSGISSYLNDLGILDPAIAGMMLSLYTGGGICGNFILPFIQKKFNTYTLPYAYSLVVIGLIFILFIHNIILISLGIFLSGMGFITLMSTYQVYNGLVCNEEQVASASTLVLASNQLGVFVSSFFISLTSQLKIMNTDITNTFFICLLIYTLMLIIMLIIKSKLLPYTIKKRS